ncbi:hypothetical protein ACN3XK_36215 [Actinomadura welshii]
MLGSTAMAGAISIGAAAPADAGVRAEPEPRGSLPPVCRQAMSTRDRDAIHMCRQAWLAMHEESRRRSGYDGETHHQHEDRYDRRHRHRRRPSSSRWFDDLLRHWATAHPTPKSTPPPASPRTAEPGASSPEPAPARSKKPSAKATRTRAAEPTRTGAPQPTRTLSQADDMDAQPPSLQPVLLLGLLLPAVMALCFPFRHRLYAATGLLSAPTGEPVEQARPSFGYRPALDPFAAPILGFTGLGAAAAIRIMTVTALEEHGETSLVVIPRPDTAALFGLAEDELLDDDAAALFIPGNLDAALAYLETELAIRENTGVTQARRLLLVADPEVEIDRIKAILDRHPGGVSVILLGSRTDDTVTVAPDGLVDAPINLAVRLPERLPALSRTEARDRLFAALARQKQNRKPPTKRRPGPRRP